MAKTELELLVRRAGGADRVCTVVEVGACFGEESLSLAARYPRIRVTAIEPIADLAAALRKKSADFPNYAVVEAAVAAEEEERTFHVFAEAPHLSSLNRISDDGSERYGRNTDEADAQHVRTKTLSSICDEVDFDSIDVLHIDTQGSDLDVLASLDKRRLETVSTLSIEATRRTALYDSAPSGAAARKRLAQFGFRIFRIDRVSRAYANECNYFFVRTRPWERRLGVPFVRYALALPACDLRALFTRMRNRAALGTRARRALAD